MSEPHPDTLRYIEAKKALAAAEQRVRALEDLILEWDDDGHVNHTGLNSADSLHYEADSIRARREEKG